MFGLHSFKFASKSFILKENNRRKLWNVLVELFRWIIFLPSPSLLKFYEYWKKVKWVFKMSVPISHSKSDSCIVFASRSKKIEKLIIFEVPGFFHYRISLLLCFHDLVFLKFLGSISHNINKFIQNTLKFPNR